MPMFLGALLPFLPAAGRAIGSVFGGASKNRQQGRADESQLLLQQDRNRLLGGQLDLAQRQFQEQAPANRLNLSGRADLLGRIGQAVQSAIPRVREVGGRNITMFGIDPSQLGDPSATTRGLADLIQQQMFNRQQQGDQFQPFTPSQLPQPTGFDKFLNIGAGVGAGLAGVGEVLGQRRGNRERILEEVQSGDNTFVLPGGRG